MIDDAVCAGLGPSKLWVSGRMDGQRWQMLTIA